VLAFLRRADYGKDTRFVEQPEIKSSVVEKRRIHLGPSLLEGTTNKDCDLEACPRFALTADNDGNFGNGD
jgi:hypothetical protein